MDILVKRGQPLEQKTACLIVPVTNGRKLGGLAAELDRASRGLVGRLTKRGDVTGAVGETLMLPEVPGVGADRVLLVGAGKADGVRPAEYRQLLDKAARESFAFGNLIEI